MTTSTQESRPVSREIALELIDAGHWRNPRGDVDTACARFAELVASIRAQGLLEPVVVGPAMLADGRHPLIAGWRRLAACAAAGQDTIEVHERGDITDERAALRAALAENVARQDMTPTAEAHALARLIALGDTQVAAAKAIGVSERTARERLRLLTLPASVTTAIDTGRLPSTATRRLAQIAAVSPQAADALGARLNAGALAGHTLLDPARTIDELEELREQGVALMRVTQWADPGRFPLPVQVRRELRARAREADRYGSATLNLEAPGEVLVAAANAGKLLTLPAAAASGGTEVRYVAGADWIEKLALAALERHEQAAEDRARQRERDQAKQVKTDEQDPGRHLVEQARGRQADLDERARPHAEAMNAEIARRIQGMGACALQGPVAKLILDMALNYDRGLEDLIEDGYKVVGLAKDDDDRPAAEAVTQAKTPEAGAAVLIGGLVAYYFADARGVGDGRRRRQGHDGRLVALVLEAGVALKLLPDRAVRLHHAHEELAEALEHHARDPERRRMLAELAHAGTGGLSRTTLLERCGEWKDEATVGDPLASVNVFAHELDRVLEDLQAAGLVASPPPTSDAALTEASYTITAEGTTYRGAAPASPPVLLDVDEDLEPVEDPAAVASADPGDGHAAGRVAGVAGRRGDVLACVTERPGVTIPELAEAIGVRQNTLYRLLPKLAVDGKLHKRGRGWHPGTPG